MNDKHPATPQPPSKSHADVLAEVLALLEKRVTDAPKPVTADAVVGLVGQLLDATARLTNELVRTQAEVVRVNTYCDTLHDFIKKGGLQR